MLVTVERRHTDREERSSRRDYTAIGYAGFEVTENRSDGLCLFGIKGVGTGAAAEVYFGITRTIPTP